MGKVLRVLLIEDSPIAAAAVQRFLAGAGYQLESLVVDAPGALEKALATRTWDIVLSDYVMPDFTGQDALEICQRCRPEVPFVCISGEIGDEKAAELIRSGAQAFVSKSNLERLTGVVERELIAADGRKQARRAAQLAAHLAAIVESSDDAIFSKDLHGTVLSWNPAAARIYGYAAEEMIGKNIACIIPADRRGELAKIMEQLRRGEPIKRLETVRQCKDGTLIDVSLTISPIRDAQRTVIGASAIARNITERRRLERERQKLIENLQEAVSKVKLLSGLLPICANCKKIRDEHGHWEAVEVYVHEHSQADFTHGICPDCAKVLYPGIDLHLGK